jgi:hypothetical protein
MVTYLYAQIETRSLKEIYFSCICCNFSGKSEPRGSSPTLPSLPDAHGQKALVFKRRWA